MSFLHCQASSVFESPHYRLVVWPVDQQRRSPNGFTPKGSLTVFMVGTARLFLQVRRQVAVKKGGGAPNAYGGTYVSYIYTSTPI